MACFPGLGERHFKDLDAKRNCKRKANIKKYLGVETLDEYLGKIFEQALEMAFADKPQHKNLKQKLKELYYN